MNTSSRPSIVRLRGIVPPLPTPLLDRDTLDVAGLERLISRVIEGGVHGLFILGTTGEGPCLSYRLRRELIAHACRLSAGRVPVLVGITDTSFVESVQLAHHAADAGAAGLVFATPYYFPLTQAELLDYVRRILPELPLPAMLYNMPRMTKVAFEPDTVRRLLDLERIAGIKDSCGDLAYFEQILEIAKQRQGWSVFVGPERLLAETLLRGGSGGVNSGANLWPRLFVDLFDAATRKDESRVRELHEKVIRLGRIYQAGPTSAPVKGIKCALSLAGVCGDAMTEPFTPFGEPERTTVQVVLEELGISI